MMKTVDYLKILAKKLARKGNKEKIEEFKTKLDIFLMRDRITFDEYNEILEILEPSEMATALESVDEETEEA